MTDPSKIKPSHTQRAAYVYIRQSTPGQVEHNRESTARQYALADRACQLGWAKEQVVSSMKIWDCPVPAPTSAPDLLASPAKWRWPTWASFSDWKFLVWRGTMQIGIACWSCAASPTR